jgi:hypothetical protein
MMFPATKNPFSKGLTWEQSEVLRKKKNKKKVCDPQKNFSRWCSTGALWYIFEVLPKKKIKKKYVIHKKILVGGALEVLFGIFLTDGSKSASWSTPCHLCNLDLRLLHDISPNKKSFLLRSSWGNEVKIVLFGTFLCDFDWWFQNCLLEHRISFFQL